VAALLQPSKQQQQRERLHDDAETHAQTQTQIQKSRRTRIGRGQGMTEETAHARTEQAVSARMRDGGAPCRLRCTQSWPPTARPACGTSQARRSLQAAQ
jgi:hypothetical protein